MKLQIANDIPSELIDLARKCNFNVIPESQREQKLRELSILANKYIPRKTQAQLNNISYTVYEVGDCPSKLANLINQMDFSKISKVKKIIALPIIKSYLITSGMLQR